MRIALITETYPRNMGYLETGLPKYLARLGADVHVIATDLPPYHRWAPSNGEMPAFIKDQAMVAGSEQLIDGYTVHILGTGWLVGAPFIRRLVRAIAGIRPDVIYVTAATGWLPLQAAAAKVITGGKLFIGNHTSFSGFPLARQKLPLLSLRRAKIALTRWMPGRLVSLLAQRCYCVTDDAAEVAWRFFGVQKHKAVIAHLGVDTDVFHPVRTAAELERRQALRRLLGFGEEDVVCIHTGKLIPAKMPQLLAAAVGRLRAHGLPFRGLFIGDGPERAQVEKAEGCVVLSFMPADQLADYYRAADIAVWPAQESISMLDAAACGLPLVVSERIYQDHVTGNGYSYRQGDPEALEERLVRLGDQGHRNALGAVGAHKIVERFSWSGIASGRMRDFQVALTTPDSTAGMPPSESARRE